LKTFGEPFKEYETFGIKHVSFPDNSESFKNIREFGVEIKNLDELTILKPPSTHTLTTRRQRLRVLTDEQLSTDSKKKILHQVKVGVAPVARAYEISSDQPDLSLYIKKTLPNFNYYVVELGLNVLTGREASIPDLMFEVDLFSDGGDRTDVITNSVAPTDTLHTAVAVSGKIQFGVTKLLELVPVVGKYIKDIIPIEIDPIKFSWELKKYDIDTKGPLDYSTSWRVYNTETVQSFNPMMILRSRKKINKIWADARVTYRLGTGILKLHNEIYSDKKQVSILPI
jgi:hypothetical protein